MRFFLKLVVLAAALAAAIPAIAQTSAEIVGTPIEVARLDRLLAFYVQPTPDEAEAIDGLYEAYLARFHDEIDPLVQDAARAIAPGSAAGSPAALAKWLREAERLQARVADVDAAFLSAATEAVAEVRRGGFNRIRDSRARQRQLAGVVALVPVYFGERPAFVDLADLLARPAVLQAVAADKRDAFDSALRSLESRTLAGARRFNESVAKAIQPVEGTPSFDEPKAMLHAQFEANQAACRALEGILPAEMLLALRTAAARGAIGQARWLFASTQSVTDWDLGWLGAQIARDPLVGEQAKTEVAKVIAQWRAEHLEGVEMFAQLSLDAEPAADADSSHPMYRRVSSANGVMRDAQQRALRAINQALGTRARAHVEAEDAGSTFAAIELDEEQPVEPPQSAPVAPVVGIAGFPGGAPVVRARELVRVLEPLALSPDAMSSAEAVVEAWISAVYEPKVRTIGKEIGDIRLRMDRSRADARAQHEADSVRLRDLQRALVRELFAADELLYADLAPALGVGADAPEIMALRTERILLLEPAMFIAERKSLTTPVRVARGARVEPAVARALLARSADAWRALVADLPRLCADELARIEWVRALQYEQRFGEPDARQRASEEWNATVADGARAASHLVARVSAVLDGAVEAASDDASVRAALARVRRAQMFPGFFNPRDCATERLAAAAACDGLDDARRARLEAIRSAYDARFDALTGRMIAVSLETALPPIEVDGALARLRGIRGECTDLALRRARRTLGDELVQRVRGLAPPAVSGSDPFGVPAD